MTVKRHTGLQARNVLWSLVNGNPEVKQAYWEGGSYLVVHLYNGTVHELDLFYKRKDQGRGRG